jgi:hypothetical protein
MIDKYFELLSKQIDDKVLQLQDALGAGYPQDYSEYKKVVGEIQGLLTARRNISDLQERLRESDDD